MDVCQQSSRSPPSPLSRNKHTSYSPISPIRKSALFVPSKVRSRHCSEPAKGEVNIVSID